MEDACIRSGNLFAGVPSDLPGELVEEVLQGRGFRLERIVSRGHRSPDDFWYDQPLSEWVVLLTGSASLRFENRSEPIEMKPGDWIHIPAHARHRIERTDAKGDTFWLALHHE